METWQLLAWTSATLVALMLAALMLGQQPGAGAIVAAAIAAMLGFYLGSKIVDRQLTNEE